MTNCDYKVMTADKFCAMEIPPRKYLLYPFIEEKSITQMYGERGCGKTFLALSMACAVASGGAFMRFDAKNACKVLYIDGEMPAYCLQERLKLIQRGFSLAGHQLIEENFQIFTSDIQDAPMPNLSTRSGQEAIEPFLQDVKLVIIDNISTLCNLAKENDADCWREMQDWLLSLRRRNISVLLIDHAGKNGTNRGTSKKQDIMDSIIALKKPEGHKQSEGIRTNITFEKSRSMKGGDIESFEAVFSETGQWESKDIQSPKARDSAFCLLYTSDAAHE